MLKTERGKEKMMKKASMWLIAATLIIGLSACGGKNNKEENTQSPQPTVEVSAEPTSSTAPEEKSGEENKSEKKTITYLDKAYELPAKTETIVIVGAVESMEDALVLDVKPAGATTVGGEFPEMFASIMKDTVKVGEKTQPSVEDMLKLKPDVILASTKFPAESLEKFESIAVTIPVSHISTNWEANLKLLGELTGKEEQVKAELDKYRAAAEGIKAEIGDKLKDKTVLLVRIRGGSMYIYPQDVYLNPSLYEDLGASVPEAVTKAEAQQLISLEMLTEINPDYLFIQFSEGENADTPKALEELQKNPIFKSVNAVKNNQLFVNMVDPIAQGGTAHSKIIFLDAAKKSFLDKVK